MSNLKCIFRNTLLANVFYLAIAIMLFFSTSTTFANSVDDIQSHWAETQIQKALQSGFVKGYIDSTFRPNNTITRAEFITMTNAAFSIPLKETAINFNDVHSEQWFAINIGAAVNASYVKGYSDNSFRPDQFITRMEAASVIFNLTKITGSGQTLFNDTSEIATFAKQAVSTLDLTGIMVGYSDGYFRPSKYISRSEAVVLISRAKDYIDTSSTSTPSTPISSDQITSTPVNVSVSITGIVVNLRARPGTSYDIMGQVKRGYSLTATEHSSNNWYKVQFSNLTGWISGQYITETSSISRGNDARSPIVKQTADNGRNYVWIWELSKSEGGSIDALIRKAKALNIGYIIKTHDGNLWLQNQAAAITKLVAAGIPCGAWGYCYGNHVQDEINCVKNSFAAGASFYVADVEIEYENINMRDKAKQFMSAASQFGPIDYTSYAYPSYHSALPFDIFNQYCRYAIPQCYWTYIGDSPEVCFNRSILEYKQTGAKNIAPIGLMDKNVPVTVKEIKDFLALAVKNGGPISWWAYQHSTPDMLNALK